MKATLQTDLLHFLHVNRIDALPHSPQYSLNLYPNNGNTPHAASPGVQTDAMSGYGYYSGTIAVSNPENGQVDPSSKHA